MKAAIYSPYLDTLGGGERYMMTIVEILLKLGFGVDVLLDKHLNSFKDLKYKLAERFDLNINKANFIQAPVGKGSDFFSRLIFLKKYDLLFYLTDGSIFYPTANRNILHIQSPLAGQPTTSLWGRLKLKGWDLIIYNSKFTQEHSKNNWPINSQIIYPPVDIDKIKPLKKKKNILSVGRFFGYLRDKKHELIIRVFDDLYNSYPLAGWSLHLVGSAAQGDKTYLDELKKMSKDLPIIFYPNLSYHKLIKLYGESLVYWHASGYGESEAKKMEHFGITTVEAMAAGCVPVVIGKGGQVEIVEENKSGFIWHTIDQLKQYTIELVNKEDLRNKLSKGAVKRSKRFSKELFEEDLRKALR